MGKCVCERKNKLERVGVHDALCALRYLVPFRNQAQITKQTERKKEIVSE